MKKTNFLIITVSPFPFNTASANLLRLLSFGLKKQDSNVEVLIQRGQSVETFCNTGRRSGVINEIKFKYCCFTKKPKSKLLLILDTVFGILYPPYYIVRSFRNIDFVITYNNYFHEDILNIIFCRLFKIKIIHYDVDWYNKSSVVTSVFKLPKWHSYLLKKHFMTKYYYKIIVISRFLYNFYIGKSIPVNRIYLLPNLVDLTAFDIPTTINKNDNIRIGFIGAAPIMNGVGDLINALKIILADYNKLELLVVGDAVGETSQIPILLELAKKDGVEDKVIFTGRVSGQLVPGYLASCDILVLPRKKGVFAEAGFPTKLGEYLAAKKPVIITKVGDIADYFESGNELLIADPDSPVSLAEKIKFLLDNTEEMERIGANGFKWAQKNLEYTNATEKLFRFIKDNNFAG